MNIADCNIFVSSDSTGNEDGEWVYLYAQYLATISNQYTVNYYLFNAGTGSYDAAIVLQVGLGSNSLNIYNAAISGSKPDYILGARFANAVMNIPQIDCLIMNHGHNCVNSYNDTTPDNKRTPQFLEAIFQILSVHSGASVVFMTQNPRRDDETYKPMYAAILRAASLVGASVADSYKLFVDEGSHLAYITTIFTLAPQGLSYTWMQSRALHFLAVQCRQLRHLIASLATIC